ncbi:hypothetical protein JHK85_044101 [Glycine max]|nr:hypothetical protein JHK85_044101 [Glycine max]
MAKNMKEKYQKYWGDPNKLNMLLLIVVVLDPRSKVKYMNWEIDQLFDVNKANGSNSRLKSSLKSLFNEYNGHKGGTQDDTQQAHSGSPGGGVHVVAKFDKFVKCSHGSIDATGFVRLEIGQWFSLCFAYIMFGGGGGYLGRAGLFVDLLEITQHFSTERVACKCPLVLLFLVYRESSLRETFASRIKFTG